MTVAHVKARDESTFAPPSMLLILPFCKPGSPDRDATKPAAAANSCVVKPRRRRKTRRVSGASSMAAASPPTSTDENPFVREWARA